MLNKHSLSIDRNIFLLGLVFEMFGKEIVTTSPLKKTKNLKIKQLQAMTFSNCTPGQKYLSISFSLPKLEKDSTKQNHPTTSLSPPPNLKFSPSLKSLVLDFLIIIMRPSHWALAEIILLFSMTQHLNVTARSTRAPLWVGTNKLCFGVPYLTGLSRTKICHMITRFSGAKLALFGGCKTLTFFNSCVILIFFIPCTLSLQQIDCRWLDWS